MHATFCPYYVLETDSGTLYIQPVLLAKGRLPVGVGRWSRMRRPRIRPRQAGYPGPWDSAQRALRPVREELRCTVFRQIATGRRYASADPDVQKSAAVERREAHFPDRKGRWRASQRAGVFATPRGFASPASLGASRPLISRAHRAAATRTAACAANWRFQGRRLGLARLPADRSHFAKKALRRRQAARSSEFRESLE